MPKGKPVDREKEILSSREIEVLYLFATRGCTYEEAADALGISLNTVRSHVTNLKKPLRARTMAHAVSLGHEKGLLASSRTKKRPAPPIGNEMRVLNGLSNGRMVTEIAGDMNFHSDTVYRCIVSMYKKTGTHTHAQLVHTYYCHGYLKILPS